MKKILLSVFVAFIVSNELNAQQTKQAVNATRSVNPAQLQAQSQLYSLSQPGNNTMAISGYYLEGFEATTFPPTGWRRESVQGANQWSRSTAEAHTGVACAFISYQSTGGLDWLILPHYSVTATTDSLTFWLKLDFQGYPPDSLAIKVSTTDSATASFTTTLLLLQEGTNYPPNATTWYRYAVSLSAYNGQNIYVAFKHYNLDGDGLYIDAVTIGTPPASEVAASAVISPSSFIAAGSVVPQVSFINNGTATQTFNVTTDINPGGYTSTSSLTALAPGATATASFAAWTPAAGTYTLTSYSQLAGDADQSNDTITKIITVLPDFENYGWSAMTALPAGRWATAPVFVKNCISSTDTGFVYLISGADAAFANTNLNTQYNTVTGTYTNKAVIPQARMQITPVHVNGKIYVIGGYSGSFAPVTTNSIYDVATDTWSTGAVMPQAVGDYAVAVYNDSLIYYVGGYSGSADVNLVQIYDTYTNTWTSGTVKTGTAVSGGRMGISGNKIVFVGGYSQTLASSLSDALLGVINPSAPATITWSTLSAYPGGTTGRHGAGVALEDNGLVYFAGGDPNGAGTAALNSILAYNTNTSSWEMGPSMITGVSNISHLAGAVYNDSLYLVTMGGYNGTSVVTTNHWLNIGPAAPLPAAENDLSFCINNLPDTIHAFNAETYAWSPAATLNDTTLASPIASPATTTTYTVVMEKAYGCPVTDSVKVTVNALPVVGASATDTSICAGTSTILSGSGAVSYAWTGGVTDNTAFIPTGTASYTVTGTDANNCQDTATISIEVLSLPAVVANSNATTACAGDTIILYGTGADTYTWDGGVADSVAFSASASNTYIVTGVDTNGCQDTASIAITVNSLPVVTVAFSPGIVCMDDAAFTLSGESPAGGSWSGTGVTGNNFDPAVAGTGSFQILYSYTDINGCSDTAADTLTVDVCAGINAIADKAVSLYPNPVVNMLTIQLESVPSTAVNVEIINAQGQVSQHLLLNAETTLVDISNLQSGIYFVRVVNGLQQSGYRLIKK